eukprot:1189866-Prorocentrum_minimum.AAC.1
MHGEGASCRAPSDEDPPGRSCGRSCTGRALAAVRRRTRTHLVDRAVVHARGGEGGERERLHGRLLLELLRDGLA